ncbi:MAG: TAXI family TRAP transporter solute-binding subunit [Alphaproteobacteria bacterium]
MGRSPFFWIVLMGLFWSGLPVWAQEQSFLRIGTGTSSGTYFLMGGLLANAISNPEGSRPCDKGGSCGVPGLVAVAQSTEGSMENIQMMVQGQMESAIVQADLAYYAFYGLGPFKKQGPARHLRLVSRLYNDVIHGVVKANSPIKTLKAIKGRTIGMGEPFSGTAASMPIVLSYYGVSLKTFTPAFLKLEKVTEDLEKGRLDGFLLVGGTPLAALWDLGERVPLRLLPVPFQPKMDPTFYRRANIAEKNYPDTKAVETLAIPALWLVSDTQSLSRVHAMTASFWHPTTQAFMANGHHQGKSMILRRALEGGGIPLHAGAEQFYREKGLLGGKDTP